jgi:hypothetical protein
MRTLTKKQKLILNEALSNDPEIDCFMDLSAEVIDKLEQINDTEILFQEINQYIYNYRSNPFSYE